MATIDLSVIIPTLNEEKHLNSLLKSLSDQRDVSLEIIIADGGSCDSSLDICRHLQQILSVPVVITQSKAGRALQMNLGANQAKSANLLFLHADTLIDNPCLLADALASLKQFRNQSQDNNIAGHFSLRFHQQQSEKQRTYYFYESKTSLNRMDTINGDQGILISRSFFESLGCFDETLPYMEDARLARRVFEHGRWITLPGYVNTSARRFETEGLKQRQTLNAILCNFVQIGFLDFFQYASDAYKQQDRTKTLQLKPFLQIIHRLLLNKGWFKSIYFWYLTGAYVVSNTWQLFYLLDCNRNFKQQCPPGTGSRPWLNFYDHWIAPALTLPPGSLITALLTLTWFYGLWLKESLVKQ